MSKRTNHDDIHVRQGLYGSLVWNETVPEQQKGGEVLFGRQLALYDHVTGNLSMLPVYADPDNRGMALARIGNWSETQSKRARQAYSSLCLDCRGMGRKEIVSDDFDMELFMDWYAIEKNALAANDIIKKVMRKIWGSDISALLNDLSIPGHIFQGWNTWIHLMGRDVTTCLQSAFIQTIRTEDGYRLFSGDDWDNRDLPEKYEDCANVREDFARAWRAKEDDLLALPPERRPEAWEN